MFSILKDCYSSNTFKKEHQLRERRYTIINCISSPFYGLSQFSPYPSICLFISSLCKVRSVNFSKLSAGFDNNVATSSNYRRIQRFIADEMGFQLIFSLLSQKGSLVLVLDRTNKQFVGKDWLALLNENNIRYHIRIRNNFKVYCPKNRKE